MVIPLYLVRHGAIHHGLDSARLPFPDSPLALPLTDLARHQVAAAAAQLPRQAGDYFWLSTELPRAQQSAALLAAEFTRSQLPSPNPPDAPKYSIIAGGGEQYFGDWCGKTWHEIAQEFPHHYKKFWQDAWLNSPPNGESFCAASHRIMAWFQQICVASKQINAKGVVMICHAGTIRVISAALQKLPPQSALELEIDVPHWSVSGIVPPRSYHA